MPSCPNSSKQPTCTQANNVMGSPASIAAMLGGEKCMLRSTSPRASAGVRAAGAVITYSISIKPSARRSVSTTYSGAQQSGSPFAIRILVVSGGPSWTTAFAWPSSRLAAHVEDRVPRNPRRVWLDNLNASLQCRRSAKDDQGDARAVGLGARRRERSQRTASILNTGRGEPACSGDLIGGRSRFRLFAMYLQTGREKRPSSSS
jgi:hypothetical protein